MLVNKDREIEDRKNSGGATITTKQSLKRTKFQLDSDSEGDDVFMGFTHKGKLLAENVKDDFDE